MDFVCMCAWSKRIRTVWAHDLKPQWHNTHTHTSNWTREEKNPTFFFETGLVARCAGDLNSQFLCHVLSFPCRRKSNLSTSNNINKNETQKMRCWCSVVFNYFVCWHTSMSKDRRENYYEMSSLKFISLIHISFCVFIIIIIIICLFMIIVV